MVGPLHSPSISHRVWAALGRVCLWVGGSLQLMAGTSPPLKGDLGGASPYPPDFILPEKGILKDPGGRPGALSRTGVPSCISK